MPGAAGAKSASAEAQSAAKQKELNAVGTLLREAANLQGRLTECGSGNEALADLASAADLDTEVRSWALSELSSADERFAALVAEAQLMADDNALSGEICPAALQEACGASAHALPSTLLLLRSVVCSHILWWWAAGMEHVALIKAPCA